MWSLCGPRSLFAFDVATKWPPSDQKMASSRAITAPFKFWTNSGRRVTIIWSLYAHSTPPAPTGRSGVTSATDDSRRGEAGCSDWAARRA